jgi:triacylglycerol lipase
MSDSDDNPTLVAAWSVIKRGATSVGRSIADAYHAVDPDVRRHAFQLPLAGLSLLVPRPRPVDALPPDGYRPVIFVHGLGGHPGNFFALKTYFAGRGRTRTYVVDFGNASSFDVMVSHLRNVIDEVVERNALGDDEKVDVVAHSMGGLITRLVVEDPEQRERIANLVTLGTPHVGSHLARLAATRLTIELRPGSETMRRLKAQDFWGHEESPLLTAFWSPSDTVVLPAESAKFPAGRTIEVAGVTHYGYLIDPSVWRQAWAVLLS